MKYVKNVNGAALVMVIVIGILVAFLSMVSIMSTKRSMEKISSRREVVLTLCDLHHKLL